MSIPTPSSTRKDVLGIGLFALLTFGLSWTLVPFFGHAWAFGGSVPTRLLGVVLPYVIMMGWQPLVAVLIVRAWAEPSEPLDAGLRPATPRYMTLAVASALGLGAIAGLLKWLAGNSSKPWFAPLASALPNAPSSLDALISVVCLGVSLLLIWAQAIGEEIGFRGYLLQRSMNVFGFWLGLVLQAFLWGLWYAPVILLSRHNLFGGALAGGTFIVTCVLLGALLGCLRLVASSITPSSAANSILTLGAGLPFVLNGTDIGLRSAIYEPCGWLPLLLLLIGLRCVGASATLGHRRARLSDD